MKLIDIASGPWAIQPEKLIEIMNLYDAHLKRDKIDLEALSAQLGRPLGSKEQSYELEDGVAIIPLDGVICKRANMMTKISGGCSTEIAKDNFEDAMEDGSVDAIIFDVNSPGGAVAGTQEFADAIYAARGRKPIYAVANGQMCSAAYWIGAACDKVFITEKTTTVGSIGVVTQHIDVSSANKKEGVRKTEIFAGKYKRIASENEPLSKDGKTYLQEKVDYMYSLFVADIAKYRGVSEDEVLNNMADGQVFIGQQAIDAGLVDGVSTLDEAISMLASGDLSGNKTKEAMTMANETIITRDLLASDHPEIFEAIKGEGSAAEMARIKSVFEASLPGHESLIEALAFDGKTTGETAALQVVNAEKAFNKDRLTALKQDAADATADVSEGDIELEAGQTKDWTALVAEAVTGGMTQAEAVRSVLDSNPEAHKDYLKGLEA